MNNKVSLPPISDLLNTSYPQPYQPYQGHYKNYNVNYPNLNSSNLTPGNSSNPASLLSYSTINRPELPSLSHLGAVPLKSNPIGAGSLSQGPAPVTGSSAPNYYYHSQLYKVNLAESITPPAKSSPTFERLGSISPKVSSGSEKRKTRNNLPKETTYILLKWLNDHLNHPYPNSFEKNQLMMSTGLNQQQLSNWFINARRRKIKGLKEQQRVGI